VLGIGYLTNGSHALFGYVAELTGGKAEKSHSVLAGHELSHVSCRTCKLCALTGIKLYVVDNSTNGNVYEGKCVTGLDVSIRTADNHVAYFKTNGSDDIALNAVFILNECDESRAVRIVLKSHNSCGNAELGSLEVDYSVLSAISAAAMANGDSAVAVTSGIFLEGLEQASLGSYFR
jgi:hypothetical protein